MLASRRPQGVGGKKFFGGAYLFVPLRPEGPKIEAEDRQRGGVLSHQLGGLKERCKLPQWGPELRSQTQFGRRSAPKTHLVGANMLNIL